MKDSLNSTELILHRAKAAYADMKSVDEERINRALAAIADALIEEREKILSENRKDLELAKGKISEVMLDRLRLTEDRIRGMANGILEIAALPSPIFKVLEKNERPNGLIIEKVSVPMGVVAIIYESRPNVTSDAAAIALKSGNVCILRGGKEAYNSSKAIVDAMKRGLRKSKITEDAVNLIEDTTRESAYRLMRARGFVDLLIPRGGAGLIRSCVENATVPCLETGTGICHIYVDKDADIEKALRIVENAKTSRPSVCNAAEVCIIHRDILNNFLPRLKLLLSDGRKSEGKTPVLFKADAEAAKIINAELVGEDDFDTEFLDYTLAIKTVGSIEEAIEHISLHSTSHSEAIITENESSAHLFTTAIDSAAVYVNASTRFTDGGEFGLGCEMGISTQKMHARGPLGIKELTTYKYIIKGDGQIR